jgi:protoporphyrinogen/coproporphyrinogen III oxidase
VARSSSLLRVGVVGGGITGLLTAVHLADRGARVTVFEADDRVGGQVRSIEVAGATVDVGAESLHTGAPGVLDLLRRLDLEQDVVEASTGPTWLATQRGLRRLPAGMGPAGPSRLWPVVTSRVLSPAGLLRAAGEPFVRGGHPEHDVSVGTYLTQRFGPQLTDRLVDPLLGNLHAGDVHRLSLAAATPQLDRAARRHRSLVLGRRRAPAGPPPRFVTLPGGLGRITDALAADPRIEVRCASRVEALLPLGDGHRIVTVDGTRLDVDAVVLAIPTAAASRLVAAFARPAARLLALRETATVATAILAYRGGDISDRHAARGTGVLVPSGTGRHLKAATFLTTKWPHLATSGTTLVRLSAGRAGDDRLGGLDDEGLVHALRADLDELTGTSAVPVAAVVHRWPATMPQLVVGHREDIATIRGHLEPHRITIAGAAYDGVGIASCLTAAAAAAQRVVPTTTTEQAA